MGAESHQSTLLAELEETRHEVRRLRALLVAKDAELGETKGRVVQLEATSLRLAHLVALPRVLIARALRIARVGLRRARG